jgi:hypothetical protein
VITWQRDPEFWSTTRAERAYIEGHELVAFVFRQASAVRSELSVGKVWLPTTPALGSPEKYAKRLTELMNDNDAFDELIDTLEADRSIKREGMRQIASEILGYTAPKSRGRAAPQ